jgi:hypothetical protein
MDIRYFATIVAIFAACFFLGMNCGPSYQDVSSFMQSDTYKAQKAAHEKRINF